ncbi:unnamed protein product [Peronospora destructor]|uniref:26S proteasome non-ATPase regulatory subunit 9 n=1 Tax=Peronospora destructor TaxID=86335 RepID=A0AAV0V259_9STRA|nr:unnamed protein product [Peronospora destructor]
MGDVIIEYEDALKAKQAIEEEIEAYAAELSSGNNPGSTGSLVDAKGFPRADIDVYRIRQLRHSMAVKQTDHRLIMRKIEELLPQVFQSRRGKSELTTSTIPPVTDAAAAVQSLKTEEVITQERELPPFAVVESVERESPAEMAGLQVQDQVLRFGSADASNHRELAAVKDIVQRNIGSGIRVLVRRETQLVVVELIPQTWSGPGVLGCLLQPL